MDPILTTKCCSYSCKVTDTSGCRLNPGKIQENGCKWNLTCQTWSCQIRSTFNIIYLKFTEENSINHHKTPTSTCVSKRPRSYNVARL